MSFKNNESLPTIDFDGEFTKLLKQQDRITRIKERMIEDSVLLVLRWRQLSEQRQDQKITLKQGAEIIGVAKKSLDDYLLQLRLGCKYGFDFKLHSSSKIGVLRTFNRTMKKNHKEKKFSAGRKRKDEEEDYTRMIRSIITEMHGSTGTITKEIKTDSNYDFKSLL